MKNNMEIWVSLPVQSVCYLTMTKIAIKSNTEDKDYSVDQETLAILRIVLKDTTPEDYNALFAHMSEGQREQLSQLLSAKD
jgi:hypothetical protein